MDRLVWQAGGEEAAFEAITEAVNTVFDDGHLVIDANGLYRQVFDIFGISVTVSGRIVGGLPRVGTAWIAV